MALAETEYGRLLNLVDQLDEGDWSKPTDCELWDVRALLSHVLGGMEANARVREFVRQFRLANKEAKVSGRPFIDHMTARQVKEHQRLSVTEVARDLHETAPKALKGRRGTPALVRKARFAPGPPVEGKWSVGYLVDVILNRVDLARATGKVLDLTADHDGRIIADVVAEWARAHGQPFRLTLEGPAGGTFATGEAAEELRLDAVEFCRILSGRAEGAGLLGQEIPF
jgi:uncharacterized protein (TIGR03083 family)